MIPVWVEYGSRVRRLTTTGALRRAALGHIAAHAAMMTLFSGLAFAHLALGQVLTGVPPIFQVFVNAVLTKRNVVNIDKINTYERAHR
jgi:hypothetical protein